MSKRYPGGIITGSVYTPTISSGSGFWTLPQQLQNKQANRWQAAGSLVLDYIIVGGGGGGGSGDAALNWAGAGGGAGGVVVKTGFFATSGSYTVVIGSGGPSAPVNNGNATAAVAAGVSSTFNGFTALGGGAGGGQYTTNTGISSALLSGGSGGGNYTTPAGTSTQAASASGGLGNAGGTGGGTAAASYAGGGGGAGGIGTNGSTTSGGQGGTGYRWFDGNIYASGGGGGGLSATITGGLGGGQPGSLAFSGGQYLAPPASSQFALGTGDFTIESWVYPTANNSGTFMGSWTQLTVPGDHGIYFTYGSLSQTNLGTVGTTNCFGFFHQQSNGFNIRVVSGTYAANAWYHVAVTRSGNTFTLYVNGTRAATGSYSGSLVETQIYIGVNSPSYLSNYFNGYLSNFRVVSKVVYTGNFVTPSGPFSATQSANPFGGSNVAVVTSTILLLAVASPTAYITDSGTNGYSVSNSGVTYSVLPPMIATYTGGGGGGGSYVNSVAAVNGIANTGGGGGGTYQNNNPGAGGSGITIIRYPGSVAAASGGNVTISGGYVYHTFTTSSAFVV